MRVLVIVDYLPYPLTSGNSLRNYNLIRQVAKEHEVWVVGFVLNHDDVKYVPHFLEFCAGAEAVPFQRRSKLEHLPGLVKFALEGKPLEQKFKHSPELAEIIQRLDREFQFDIVQIEHSYMALYLEELPPESKAKTILVLHNLAFEQFERITKGKQKLLPRVRSAIYSRQMKHWEPTYAERFDKCVMMSEIDEQKLKEANPRLNNTVVVPNGVDVENYHPLPKPETNNQIMFIGSMSYAPCIDAVLYFVETVLPLIWEQRPDVEFWIVGREPGPEILALGDDERVHVTGLVESVLPYYERVRLSIVPLRSGGGTRLKILESLALGRPVVSTTIGAEGITIENGTHGIITDDPEEFAARTVKLLDDDDLYNQLVTNGRKLVEDHYDWRALGQRLLDVYESLVQS